MIQIRKIENIDDILAWRKEVIKHVFNEEPNSQLMDENTKYYLEHLANNSHLAFEALYNDEKAGCGGICFTEELPSPDNPSGKCAYFMNIYVKNKFREHGIGHEIVKKLIKVAREKKCHKIYLETTDMGRNLYTSLGFVDIKDFMKLKDEI